MGVRSRSPRDVQSFGERSAICLHRRHTCESGTTSAPDPTSAKILDRTSLGTLFTGRNGDRISEKARNAGKSTASVASNCFAGSPRGRRRRGFQLESWNSKIDFLRFTNEHTLLGRRRRPEARLVRWPLGRVISSERWPLLARARTTPRGARRWRIEDKVLATSLSSPPPMEEDSDTMMRLWPSYIWQGALGS